MKRKTTQDPTPPDTQAPETNRVIPNLGDLLLNLPKLRFFLILRFAIALSVPFSFIMIITETVPGGTDPSVYVKIYPILFMILLGLTIVVLGLMEEDSRKIGEHISGNKLEKAIQAIESGQVPKNDSEIASLYKKIANSATRFKKTGNTSSITAFIVFLNFYYVVWNISSIVQNRIDESFYIWNLVLFVGEGGVMISAAISFFYLDKINTYKKIIDGYSINKLSSSIFKVLVEFAHTNQDFTDNATFEKQLGNILAVLQEWEQFHHGNFFKTAEYNLISSYRSYLISTKNMKKVLILLHEVKTRAIDIKLRNQLKNGKQLDKDQDPEKGTFFDTFKEIVENYIEDLRQGIENSEKSKELAIANNTYLVTFLGVITSAIIAFLV